MTVNNKQLVPVHRMTVKTVLIQMGETLIEHVLSYIAQYRKLDSVHFAIAKNKIYELLENLEIEQDVVKNHLVLLRYFSTEEIEWDNYEYVYRFALFTKDDLRVNFHPIANWDNVLGKDDDWKLHHFFELTDWEIIQLSEFRRELIPLDWSWENWDAILHAELMGHALREPEEAVVELTARYMEYILGNLCIDSERKQYSIFLEPKILPEVTLCAEEKIRVIRDYLLSEITLYGETRSAYQQLEYSQNLSSQLSINRMH